jgi:hypothetical protein
MGSVDPFDETECSYSIIFVAKRGMQACSGKVEIQQSKNDLTISETFFL